LLFTPGDVFFEDFRMAQSAKLRERKRVQTQQEAADLLGISPQRLQDMRRNAPWWRQELGNDGWDVVGIALAQADYHKPEDDLDLEIARRKKLAVIEELEESAKVRRLEREKRQRVEAQAARELVSVVVVTSLLSEALSELRSAIDDVPYVFSREVPPEFVPLVFAGDDQPALLQRLIARVVEDYQRWLDRVPAELFDDDDQPEVADG
jgi:phage terminase Nu1 subunit (DNA packaging protein)